MQFSTKSLLLVFCSLTFNIFGQNQALESTFKKYEIIHLNSASYKNSLTAQREDAKHITINGWDLTLFNSDIIAPHYIVRVSTDHGIEQVKSAQALPMNGYTRQGGKASLTFNDNYIYGFVEDNATTYYIEPLYHFEKNAARDSYILYDQKDIIDNKKMECGTNESHRVHEMHESHGSNRQVGQCFEVEYAIANDWLMFDKYGSVSAVENHAIGVTNNVQTNYDNEFADELKFIIVEQFVSNCSSCDPWTNSTNAGTVLNSFTNWAPGGFATGHDIGSLWTDREFDGSTIGIAWLGAVCTNISYNALQDFSSNANLKRVMVAHEFGHNFDADHDAGGSPFIMAPAVQNTNQWSSASITAIQNYYNNVNCLATCASGSAPTAQLGYTITQPCAPGSVQFDDQSTGTITNWNWVFDGGSPATSTLQNPLVQYNDPGIYSVTLTVSNGSLSNTLVLTDEIEILGPPTANFDSNINGNVVDFFNTGSTGGTNSYLWNFGDNSTSTLENPSHTYTNDGTYTVTLEVSNDCGSSIFTSDVVIATAPLANFTSNQTIGCNAFTVNFTSTSSNNTQSYLWTFNGGNPSTSTAAAPIVTYNTPGSYPVSLTVSNAQGTNNKTVLNYITVNASPIASFTVVQTGLTFAFTNTSTNATVYEWDFGDGMTSTATNPIHTYATAGSYTVKLNADNPLCPNNIVTQTLNATAAPISSFTATTNTGCAPMTTTFTSTSINNPTTFEWTFPGGTPSTSTAPNPTVTYSTAGIYDVTLVTSNSFGSNTLNLPNYIQINTVPNTNFNYSGNGTTYNFQNNSTNAFTYAWDFGDGTNSTVESPSHTYTAEGNYTVKLTTTNACGQSEMVQNITILFPPNANAQSTTGEICNADSITYTDLSTGTITSRIWTFEGGSPATSTDANVNVAYGLPGTYNVRLITTNAAGADTFDFTKTVTFLPQPSASFSGLPSGSQILLTNTSTAADSILWLLPNGSTFNSNVVVVSPSSNGEYTFTLNAFNECGMSTTQQTISFYNLPNAVFSSNLEELGECAPIQVIYTGPKSNEATYQWTFEGGTPSTSSEKEVIVTYPEGGIFDVSLIVTNPQGADTTSYNDYVVLGTTPTSNYAEKITGGNIQCEFTGASATSYLWNFGGQGTSIEKNPSFIFTTNGTYDVTCIATNACGSDTITKTFNIIAVNTNYAAINKSITLFPNPVNDEVTLHIIDASFGKYDALFIDNTGKQVMQLLSQEGTQKINVESLISGIYMIIVKSNDKMHALRFMKI